MTKKSRPFSRKSDFNQRRSSDRAIDFWLDMENSEDAESAKRRAEEWASKDLANREALQELDDFMQSPELKSALDCVTPDDIAGSPQSAICGKMRWRWVVGVVFALLLPLSFFDWSAQFADQRTRVGEQRRVHLDDGSVVLLNTDSALDIDFNSRQRKIRLIQGEALFEVVKDTERPFTIDMRHGKVTVVGTRFVVRTEDDNDEAYVLEGKVWTESFGVATREKRILESHDYARLEPNGDISIEQRTLPADWAQGQLVFSGTPLEEVVSEINRYLPGTLIVANRDFLEKRLTATYNIDSLDLAPEIIARTLQMDIQRLGSIRVLY
ncbi:MAG: hypothetical protein G3M78_01445 [Candidatus Nitrohelix vancouverensis]|uniref:FecR protein domain-containing protein n=1 Tax=Candidatus Nitrohelix vancouverensis TaxID=2705534 RepID=A0A7T0C072_9BACT|nr:MAG: hypothetical protein G3M78_01445 [Candidatus Nitrohelix vancouverensis]